jgi:hypothetical protein
VEQSVDILLGAPTQLTAAIGSRSSRSAAASSPGSKPAVNTQIRSKDNDGRLWVQFETAAAAQQTLAAAGIVEVVAAGSGM